MTDGVDDPELAGDVVGVASARLRARGLAPERRRRALRLLGVLGAVADAEHRVRRRLPDVAGEFGLPLDTAATALDDLIDAGVARDDGDVIVLGGAEPAAQGALRLQDFLALADELEQRRARRSPAVLRPAAALLAVAALVAIVLLAPGTTPNRGAPVSSTGPGDRVTTSTGPSTTSEGGGRSRPAGSTITTTGPDAAPTPTAPVQPPCPPDLPILEIIETRPDVEGNLAVLGLARNVTAHDLEIVSFTVLATVGGREVPTPGPGGLVVRATSSVPWQVTVPALGTPATGLEAMLGDWQWRSPTCSTP